MAHQTTAGVAASLYPFLSAGDGDHGDLGEVLADLARSTTAKLQEISELRLEVARRDGARLVACAQAMAERFFSGGRLFAFGNGGSCTDAQDLVRLFVSPGAAVRALPAFALANDAAVVTALTNDVGFDLVFARQIAALARPGDIAVGLSTSGNSANLVAALDEASRRGMLRIGVAGYNGGKMAELATMDYLFVVPSMSVHRIQEAQTTIYHGLWELTVAALENIEEECEGAVRRGPRLGR